MRQDQNATIAELSEQIWITALSIEGNLQKLLGERQLQHIDPANDAHLKVTFMKESEREDLLYKKPLAQVSIAQRAIENEAN